MRPFADDVIGTPHGRFVPGLIGVLVYLAVVSLAAMLLILGVADRWERELGSRLTVQLAGGGDQAERQSRAETAVSAIRALPEVAQVERVPEGRLAALLQPWLAGAASAQAWPLPVVLEVTLSPDGVARAGQVQAHLRAVLPQATVGDGLATVAPALRVMRAIAALALLIIAVLGTTLIGTVVFATTARLAERRDSLELLYLLGADEARIVNAVARQAMRSALLGGGAGFLLAALTLLGFALVATSPAASPAELGLSPPAWAAVTVLPLAAAAIAMLTARAAARRALAMMP